MVSKTRLGFDPAHVEVWFAWHFAPEAFKVLSFACLLLWLQMKPMETAPSLFFLPWQVSMALHANFLNVPSIRELVFSFENLKANPLHSVYKYQAVMTQCHKSIPDIIWSLEMLKDFHVWNHLLRTMIPFSVASFFAKNDSTQRGIFFGEKWFHSVWIHCLAKNII